jgi:hypothetical protein
MRHVETETEHSEDHDATVGRKSPEDPPSPTTIVLEFEHPDDEQQQNHFHSPSKSRITDLFSPILSAVEHGEHLNVEQSDVGRVQSEKPLEYPTSSPPATKQEMAHTAQHTALHLESPRTCFEIKSSELPTSVSPTVANDEPRSREHPDIHRAVPGNISSESLPPSPHTIIKEDTEKHSNQPEEHLSGLALKSREDKTAAGVEKNEHLEYHCTQGDSNMAADHTLAAQKSADEVSSNLNDKNQKVILSRLVAT